MILRSYIVLVFIPLIVGVGVYAVCRPDSFLYIGGCEMIGSPSIRVSLFAQILPDFLWLFSLLNCLGCIWKTCGSAYWVWAGSVFLGALSTEFCQHLSLIPGTGDPLDILAYVFAYGASFLLFHKSNIYKPTSHAA